VMSLDEDRWLGVDHLNAAQTHHYALHWLVNDFPFDQQGNSILLTIDSMKYKMQMGLVDGNSHFSIIRGDEKSIRGWRSQFFGHKEPAISAVLETDQPRACFWTYFGFALDSIQLTGETLKISSQDWETSINLQSLIL
jgi:hypothetical protein